MLKCLYFLIEKYELDKRLDINSLLRSVRADTNLPIFLLRSNILNSLLISLALILGSLRLEAGPYQSTEVASSFEHPYEIGAYYCVRTSDYHIVGKLVAVFDIELVFEDVTATYDRNRKDEELTTRYNHVIVNRHTLQYVMKRDS